MPIATGRLRFIFFDGKPLLIVRLAVSKKKECMAFHIPRLSLARKMARPAFAEMPFWAFRDPSNAIAPNTEPHSSRAVTGHICLAIFGHRRGVLFPFVEIPDGTMEASFES